jgi:endo-beta-N-acetylglucosaminidase D
MRWEEEKPYDILVGIQVNVVEESRNPNHSMLLQGKQDPSTSVGMMLGIGISLGRSE